MLWNCSTSYLADGELIVGSPTGAQRKGAFSDISWRWLRDELDTIGSRPQDPFYISEEDKKYLRDVIFPYWEGKSLDEHCESQYRDAVFGKYPEESFVSDCSYHQVNGGGDSNPGYDVILMKKGMLDIQKWSKKTLNLSRLLKSWRYWQDIFLRKLALKLLKINDLFKKT